MDNCWYEDHKIDHKSMNIRGVYSQNNGKSLFVVSTYFFQILKPIHGVKLHSCHLNWYYEVLYNITDNKIQPSDFIKLDQLISDRGPTRVTDLGEKRFYLYSIFTLSPFKMKLSKSRPEKS